MVSGSDVTLDEVIEDFQENVEFTLRKEEVGKYLKDVFGDSVFNKRQNVDGKKITVIKNVARIRQ